MEDPQFTVLLTDPSPGGPAALKAVRAVTGLSLWHSRQLLNGAPVTAREAIPFATAAEAAGRLRRAGVPAAIRCDWCRRTLPDDGTPVGPGPCTSRAWPTAHCQANSLTTCDCEWCTAYGPLPGHTTP
ncbi:MULTISPECIES: ribosomal protein L7/L12 [unclassified Kitasatospora]|uniref:ribosomal protein L7/L12 n=1 Tax=unclassified Kitasatospora TaxID=2633591 RepID=UPI0038257481